jgi:hypothetical protein
MQRTMITHDRLFWSGRTAHVNGLIDICKVHNPLFLWLPAGSCIRGRKKAASSRRTPKVAAATENIRVN